VKRVDLEALARRFADRSRVPEVASSTLILLSCTKVKDPNATTARELYWPSAAFREGVGYAERRGWPWAVLSAKHGLLLPGDPVTIYDETLEGMSVAARSRWADRVITALSARGWVDGSVRIEIHAGKSYAHPLAERLRERGVEVDEPLAHLGTGYRRSFYKVDREGSRGVARPGRQTRKTVTSDQLKVRVWCDTNENAGWLKFALRNWIEKEIGPNWIEKEIGPIISSSASSGIAMVLFYADHVDGRNTRDWFEDRLDEWLRTDAISRHNWAQYEVEW